MKKRLRKPARREAGHVFIRTGRGRAPDVGGQLDVARCPLCDGPMTPRLNRQGSYFYCWCHARKEEQRAASVAVAQLGGASPLHLPFPSCNNNLSSVG